jgi:hypothetical protein
MIIEISHGALLPKQIQGSPAVCGIPYQLRLTFMSVWLFHLVRMN